MKRFRKSSVFFTLKIQNSFYELNKLGKTWSMMLNNIKRKKFLE